MRLLGLIILPVALSGACAHGYAAQALPESGAAKLAAYQSCRPLAVLDMGAAGSQAATECNGIVRNLDTLKAPDNLSIHCLETTAALATAYHYSGSCVLTDADSDSLYMTYDGRNDGQFKWLGGTGKLKDVMGSGTLGVIVAPGGTPDHFAYTLNMDVTWTNKPK